MNRSLKGQVIKWKETSSNPLSEPIMPARKKKENFSERQLEKYMNKYMQTLRRGKGGAWK